MSFRVLTLQDEKYLILIMIFGLTHPLKICNKEFSKSLCIDEKVYFLKFFGLFLDTFWNSFSTHSISPHFLWGSTLFCLCLSPLYLFSCCWHLQALAWFSLSQSPSTSISANPPLLYSLKRKSCVVWGSTWVEVNQWSTSEITMRVSSWGEVGGGYVGREGLCCLSCPQLCLSWRVLSLCLIKTYWLQEV